MTEDSIKSHHYPTPKQLRNILKPDTSGLAARWHDLGTQLLTDDTVGVLDVIKADHPNDVSACCNKMFVKWLEVQPNATWSQLITALNNIGMNTVAEEVITHFSKDEKSSDFSISSSMSSRITLPSSMLMNPKQASIEFGILLVGIIKELTNNEAENLDLIKVMCSCLTVEHDPSALLFNEEQQKAIEACGSIRKLFMKDLRGCWQWDNFSYLKKIVESLDSDKCIQLLNQYEKKLEIRMKLQVTYEKCQNEKQSLPEGYHKMVAIVQDKTFSRITTEEYKELEDFVSHHCRVLPYDVSSCNKIEESSMPSSLQSDTLGKEEDSQH